MKKIFILSTIIAVFTFSCIEKEPELPSPDIFPTQLVFESDEIEKPFIIENKGKGSFNYRLTSDVSWLSIDNSSGEYIKKVEIFITVDRTGLAYQNHSGDIYVKLMDIDGNNIADRIINITLKNTEPNNPPVAAFSIANTQGDYVNTEWVFDASSCTDKESDNATLQVQWKWEVGGNFTSWSNNKVRTHTYETYGEKEITLKVRDSDGGIDLITKTLTVLPPKPGEVKTKVPDLNYITHNSVIFKGEIIDLGAGALKITDHGFYFGLVAEPESNDTKVSIGETDQTGEYTIYESGLEATNTYRVRAFVKNEAGETIAEAVTFTTTMPGPPKVIETGIISGITQSTAKINGQTNEDACIDVTISSFGHCYSTSLNPDYSDNKTEFTTLNQNGAFESNLSGLLMNTTYYVRGFIKTSKGNIIYGDQINFKTL